MNFGISSSSMVDPGAHDNLVGNQYLARILALIDKAGLSHLVVWRRLTKPLSVAGVGKQSEQAEWCVEIPVMMPGQTELSTYQAPVVGNDQSPSDIPALWGLKSQVKLRTIVDLVNDEVHLCGPGAVKIDLPPGSTTIPLESTPSSHKLVPCTEYDKCKNTNLHHGLSFQASQQYE